MKQTFRLVLGIVLGLATLLAGQVAIEVAAWWWSSGTTSLETPLLNAIKFAVASALAFAVGANIAVPARRRSPS